jgi:hypothetical protein
MQAAPVAFSLALLKAGNSMPARIAMIAMTTRSSMSVKPERREGEPSLGEFMALLRFGDGSSGNGQPGQGLIVEG